MLGSVFQTSLSAISAAGLAIQATANNLANAQTDGFKASRPAFATQSYETRRAAAAPSASSGGNNPVQVGHGTRLASLNSDFSQGSIASTANPLNLAIEGDGFFVLEGPSGEPVFSRDGNFNLDADRNLVSTNGQRVLGFNVDASFQLNMGSLEPVRLPSHPPDSGATLSDIHVEANGTLQGRFTDGLSRDLGRIELSNFANPNGLVRLGDNQFNAGSNSGLPVPANSRIVSGARELSNTSIGRELINLNRFSTMFRANLRVLETGDLMLQELMNLGRPK